MTHDVLLIPSISIYNETILFMNSMSNCEPCIIFEGAVKLPLGVKLLNISIQLSIREE